MYVCERVCVVALVFFSKQVSYVFMNNKVKYLYYFTSVTVFINPIFIYCTSK